MLEAVAWEEQVEQVGHTWHLFEGHILPWLLYGSSLLSVKHDVNFSSLQCFPYQVNETL